MANIDWSDPVWDDIEVLKSYIRRDGNGDVPLSELSQSELLKLAQATEKARTIIDVEQSICNQCETSCVDCICERCNDCYEVEKECVCFAPIKLVKTFYLDQSQSKVTALMNLAQRIRFKIFILNKVQPFKNERLTNDIIQLIRMHLEYYNIQFKKEKHKTLPSMFKLMDTLKPHMQLGIIFDINKSLGVS